MEIKKLNYNKRREDSLGMVTPQRKLTNIRRADPLWIGDTKEKIRLRYPHVAPFQEI